MNQPDSQPDPSDPHARAGFFARPGVKFFVVAILVVVLAVPLLMVWGLTVERENRRGEVDAAIAEDWGGRQSVFGPVLLVPYTVETLIREAGRPDRVATTRRTAVILPDRLQVDASAPTEVRRISIFETAVFTADLKAAARFSRPDARVFGPDLRAVDWTRAVVAVGLGDLGGIESARLDAGGSENLALEPGTGIPGETSTALHALLPPAAAAGPDGPATLDVALTMRIKGTGRLGIAPVGRDSDIRLASDWPHPNFAGGSLPTEREVRADGFSAHWRLPSLARNVPQAWTLEDSGFDRFGTELVGAGFAQPVDFYALVERALKYGLMFIAAVFGIVFVLEVLSRRRIHAVQYLLVGLIAVFFFVLLLAFAEQIGFGAAYLVASTATGLVVASFVGVALASRARAAVAAVALAVVFGLLYVILSLEDVALLAGAVVGFSLLTVVLFATRRVDWAGTRPAGGAPPA